jgi:hypothetical protein
LRINALRHDELVERGLELAITLRHMRRSMTRGSPVKCGFTYGAIGMSWCFPHALPVGEAVMPRRAAL